VATARGNLGVSATGDVLLKADNLSGLASAATARTNLGLHAVAASGDYDDLIDKPTLPTAAVDTDVLAGTSTTKYITPDAVADAQSFRSITYAATINPDFGAGINFKVTLTGNVILGDPSNKKAGWSGSIRVAQDGTGSRTISYHANWKPVGGIALTLSTVANTIDYIDYMVADDGTSIVYSIRKNCGA
jgi:hypothetical protein